MKYERFERVSQSAWTNKNCFDPISKYQRRKEQWEIRRMEKSLFRLTWKNMIAVKDIINHGVNSYCLLVSLSDKALGITGGVAEGIVPTALKVS